MLDRVFHPEVPVRARSAIFCTYVDAAAKYELQGLTWAFALLGNGVEPARLRVHHPGSASAWFLAALREHGVPTVEVPPHSSGHGYCNKVQQLTYRSWASDELLVLCDADLLWLDARELPDATFAAKLVERPYPPPGQWREILRAARGRGGEEVAFVPVDVSYTAGDSTPSLNLNGGLYVLEGAIAATLGRAWDRWAHWLDERDHLLAGYQAHRDQVAMALALLDLEVVPTYLDRGWNFPFRHPVEHISTPPVRIRALHHHGRITRSGLLPPVGVDWIDEASAAINRALRAYL